MRLHRSGGRSVALATAALVTVLVSTSTPAAAATTDVTSAHDFDQDGDADVVAIAPSGRLYLYPGDGAGAWEAPRAIGRGFGAFDMIQIAGDVDDDGAPDVLGRAGDVLYLFTGNGAGGLTGGYTPLSRGWAVYEQILASDVDADGNVDLLALDLEWADGDVDYLRFMPGNPGASFRRGSFYPLDRGAYFVMAPGDTNGDGRNELDLLYRDGRLISLEMRASGPSLINGTGVVKGTGFGGFTALLTPGDFSGDGISDVLARTADGHLLLYRGTADRALRNGIVVGNGWTGYTIG